MKSLKLALLNIKMNLKNEKQLKSSFIIAIIGMTINNMAFLIIWFYFGKAVGNINGWEPYDIIGLYGFTSTSLGIVTGLFAGLYKIPNYITTGSFDKYLLTPKNILLKVSTSSISTSSLGDIVYGIICFIIYIFIGKLSLVRILLYISLLILSCVLFFSFSLFCMTISFYLMDGHNVSDGIYGTFVSNSLYHGGAYTGVLRAIFMYGMPSLLLGAVPVEIVKGINFNNIYIIFIATILWFIISVVFFNKSLKKYESNSFMGFGN